MKLAETFGKSESRVYGSLMFVDMTASTDMKERTPEASWLTTYGWFFDVISEHIRADEGGNIVKYLGDGVMASFDEAYTAEAINAAIRIQEAIADGGAEHRVACNCSIGIATGEVVKFQTPRGDDDYIGTVADRAARLCSAASPKAVFVDRETIASASMRRVKSKLGVAKAPKRGIDEYQGDIQKIILKGFNAPIEYHEILWDQQHYGVKSQVPTDVADRVLSQQESQPSRLLSSEKTAPEIHIGTVERWFKERNHGFIMSRTGESFFCDRHYVVDSADLPDGAKVFFVPQDPNIGNRSNTKNQRRLATCVIYLGQSLQCKVKRVPRNRGFGFVEVSDPTGHSRNLFMFVGDTPHEFTDGDVIRCTISENNRGPCASEPRPTTKGSFSGVHQREGEGALSGSALAREASLIGDSSGKTEAWHSTISPTSNGQQSIPF